MRRKEYDYIIAGAGASGLSLAWRMLQSPLAEKRILIVDSQLSPSQDKTWCFWDPTSPPFADIIHKRWSQVEVSIFDNRFTQSLNHYPYYCLRSIDFEEKILPALRKHPSFDLLEANIAELDSTNNHASLQTADREFQAEYIFQSCFIPDEVKQNPPHYPLLQHFLGWEISTDKAVFDDSFFTLMDFDETVSDGLAFVYLLPWSPTSCLIEYTLFSGYLWEAKQYEEKIQIYLNNRFGLRPLDYKIQRKEAGKIPMQDIPSPQWYKPRIVNLGQTGGLTKPSTGYTFRRIQQQVESLVNALITKGKPAHFQPSKQRYKAYDLWLLQIIHDHPSDALRVFNDLFSNNSMDEVFRFLSEETTLWQDLDIMRSVPYYPFLRAIWKTAGRLNRI